MISEITELKEVKKLALEKITTILNNNEQELFHLLPTLMSTYTSAENAISKMSESKDKPLNNKYGRSYPIQH